MGTVKKGDIHCDKLKQSIKYTEDCWSSGIEIKNVDETESKILEFVDLLYKNKEYILKISDMYNVILWVTVCQDTNQYNLHFSKEILSKISELGIDINITCMQI